MFRSYLEIVLRSFLRNKLLSCINLFGLAVGLASAILIGLHVADEMGYDRFHPDADRLYRIGRDIYPREDFAGLYMATLPPVAADQLRQDYAGEMEMVARAMPNAGLISRGETAFYENSMLYADPDLLRLFRFEWLAGNPATALDSPTAIVVTESFARKYFGDESPLGLTLTFENRFEMTVTGVIRDLPTTTHVRATALRPMAVLLSVLPEVVRSDWGSNLMHTYVRLAPGVDIDRLSATFPAFIDRHIPAALGRDRASELTGISAMKVSDIHLHSTRQNEMSAPGSLAVVLSLTLIAVAIVLIACCNFTNLSTARSALRGKEVGIRKTLGAERRHLAMQFLGEAITMAALATVAAIVLVELALPAFEAFTGKTLTFDVIGDGKLQLAFVVLVLVVGVVSGSWPAFWLSAFKPVQVLKSGVGVDLRDVAFRNLLVVLQFSISIALVISTAVVVLQLRYVRAFNPGFSSEQVVVLAGSPTSGLTDRWETLRAELEAIPGVVSVTASSVVPGRDNLNDTPVRKPGAPDSEVVIFPNLMVDHGFFETYGVRLLAGRTFGSGFPGDRLPPRPEAEMAGNFILNAAAARILGWTPEQAVGQEIVTGMTGTNSIRGQVVGVVADSNFETLRHQIKPLMFLLGQQGQWPIAVFSAASARVGGRDLPDTLARIDAVWQRVIPEFPVARRFLSDDFEALYRGDTRLGQLFSSFAALAIFVACLGLFGLATFNAQRRVKEIGIRKVMGGSVWQIVLLLTNDFSRLVLLANLIAWPVAYVAMERWLQSFAYRIDLTLLIFIGSGAIALCVAWVTVAGTAVKAANAKPVLALRYE